MKKFHHKYDWTDNCCWMLPDGEEMMQNQFGIMDEQIDAILELISRTKHGNQRTAVQAGGAMGMYPLRLSYHFEKVWTFEPLIANLECMRANFDAVPGSPCGIVISPSALWFEETHLWMAYSKKVKNSYGAHHVSPTKLKTADEEVPANTLDMFHIEDVDLIWLDVEGAELMALRGAESTIKRNRPVIVLEDHSLVQMRTVFKVERDAAAKYLMNEHGYKFAGKSHYDLMFLPG